ncbi:DUF6194 family protein [Actinoplanes teichomyceticus]|uniref:Erythromycin esterase n=1 Tax=Actinoplanes teichomyceticus TaxID=1867 RepID=A0A561VSI2_ACTTI|nr:DUF6194 family protein [Actinoplanes teichomyceticus]TWG14574.1 erythromycin esterase [Actinoplanes teichomyceticus]GIF09978.1 hypothetical protein Ate01nite_00100 [Actinoplanes teichomyceticus]
MLSAFLAAHGTPRLLALGEPGHAEPAFRLLRNRVFQELVAAGFRSIAVESDRTAALAVDDHVAGGAPPPGDGFGHGPGALPADRELIAWMRTHNAGLPAAERLTFHGFAPPAAPPAADPAPGAGMVGVRDALMAANLVDIAAAEAGRGPTLVFAHNRRLRRDPGRRSPAGTPLRCPGPGAILGEVLAGRYAVILGSLDDGAAAFTFEGRLTAASPAEPALFDAARLPRVLGGAPRVRTGVPAERGRSPLDAETVAGCDAILHVPPMTPDPVDALAERIRRLPGVSELIAGPDTGAPEQSWGDRFYFAGAERMRPFATIVVQDVPGFDERSGLDRPGVFRLNVELGRAGFRELFGYGPEEFAAHRDGIDFAAAGRWFPHPVYAAQGWGSMVTPGEPQRAEVDRLVERALRRSARRASRR